jgi:hypothetical protein
MGPTGIDLKNLLEQDRQLALDVLETSSKLVLELQASHYWTTQSLDVFASLRNIGANMTHLLQLAQPYWGEGQAIFNRPEGLKLWNTALGLWQALPPVRNKISEQLSRRRRERIMGMSIIEPSDLDPVQVQADNDRYQALLTELTTFYAQLQPVIDAIPEGLVPLQAAPAPEAAGNGQLVAPKPGAHVSEVAAPLSSSMQTGVGAQGAPGTTAPPPPPPEEDLSPV